MCHIYTQHTVCIRYFPAVLYYHLIVGFFKIMFSIDRAIMLGIVMVLSVLLWFCHTMIGLDTRFAESKSIKIGVIAGLSGDHAVIGENLVKGFSLAQKVYLKKHPDVRIEVIVENDGFDAKKGVSAYRKLTEMDDVDALYNMTSPTINAIYDEVVSTDLPVIQGGEQGQDPVDDNVFQILAGNIELERRLGVYAQRLCEESTVLIHSHSSTFVRFANAFKEGYGREITDFTLTGKEQNLKTIALKIMQRKPSNIVYIGPPSQGALLVREILHITKDSPQFVFDSSFQTGLHDYRRILGDLSVLDGSVVMGIEEVADAEFVALYREEYGEDPGFFSSDSYDAFMLLMSAYDPDRETWTRNIRNVDFNGVSGRITFDEVGVRASRTELMTVQNGVLARK